MSSHDPEREGEVPQEEREDRPELDVDTAFAAIIAGWGETTEPGRSTWPAAEDLATGEEAEPQAAAPEPAERPSIVPGFGGPAPFTAGEAEDAEERFVPPDPPPLPHGDLLSRLAWAGVVGGPLFLLIAALFWRDLPQLLLLLAVAAFVGGFAVLVVRMPRDRGDDDDGAVV